jgi:class I fructose-bisphosphate aldolase
VDRIFAASDRPIPVLRSLQTLFNSETSRNGLSVDSSRGQGIEHSAGASFAPNPSISIRNIVRLAVEAAATP